MSKKLYYEMKNKDLSYGIPREKKLLNVFNEYLKCNLTFTVQYSKFDYIDTDKKILVELKSRRVKKNKYKDVLVNKAKIDYGFKKISEGYDVYISWSFIDKLCIYKLSVETFDKSWIKLNHLGRYDRGKKEFNDVVFIPTKVMKNIKCQIFN